eukprot:TRINITY_DN10923_c0_g1_i1.p1 TRINITY_DN10923_c0_g1~~TRINITY_DN10923_c0_g1_i1.p1  ORF type:complete len:316 (-),score=62.32 TRINITY_DN10923_c0_g1_i1:22-969(-)
MGNEGRWGKATTAEEVTDGIDLTGKVVIVTGCTSGIGVETARVCALRNAQVIMAVRNIPLAEDVAGKIRSQNPQANLCIMELDLSSLRSVRQFAEKFKALNLPLHYLINNGAVAAIPERRLTEDGFELTFGTNHLGHFLLTNLLVDNLIRGAPSRVIILSSSGHIFVGENTHFDDLQLEKDYSKWGAYGHSKMANILFAKELNERLKKYNIEAFSVHPGSIWTGILKNVTRSEMIADGWLDENGNEKPEGNWKSIEAGTSTTMYAVTSPEITGRGGSYLEDCHISQTLTESSRSMDNAKKLWQLSEECLNQKFTM